MRPARIPIYGLTPRFAAEYGVYGPEGKWLIEGHGVDPDVAVDNRPHATFQGEDSQLTKAIDYLQEQIRQSPVTVPPPPPHPDKSFKEDMAAGANRRKEINENVIA
jgi:C-terminal processing protease CtpA/Prc